MTMEIHSGSGSAMMIADPALKNQRRMDEELDPEKVDQDHRFRFLALLDMQETACPHYHN
jgi:hypothetical protein